jgi:hypothetical protein
MTANYVLLEKITVGAAGASSVTFSGIPQTGYTDLILKASIRTGRANVTSSLAMRFNGDTASNYTSRALDGGGTTANSFAQTTSRIVYFYGPGSTATSNTFSNTEFYIPNYTSSNYKSVSIDGVVENNGTDASDTITAGLWSSTSAITSIYIDEPFGSSLFQQYSTFYLYGVAKLGTEPAIVPYATGGDTIMTDGTYWYHAFTSSGTFTPAKALSCDYLVVAGGGGGGTPLAGGGGAGGLRSTVTTTGGGGSLESALSLASETGYTVTIGAGGAVNANGSNSVFSSITSTGGGRGGYYSATPGATGGSGGGGGGGDGTLAGGSGTANQGYAGGTGNDGAASGYVTRVGGGGGGAGAVGANANGATSVAGNGGAGVQITALATPTQTGASGYYAGGGGGSIQASGTAGTGGAGGGGTGGANVYGTSGVANTGGGAGGTGQASGTASTGGSGIVIVRYAV